MSEPQPLMAKDGTFYFPKVKGKPGRPRKSAPLPLPPLDVLQPTRPVPRVKRHRQRNIAQPADVPEIPKHILDPILRRREKRRKKLIDLVERRRVKLHMGNISGGYKAKKVFWKPQEFALAKKWAGQVKNHQLPMYKAVSKCLDDLEAAGFKRNYHGVRKKIRDWSQFGRFL